MEDKRKETSRKNVQKAREAYKEKKKALKVVEEPHDDHSDSSDSDKDIENLTNHIRNILYEEMPEIMHHSYKEKIKPKVKKIISKKLTKHWEDIYTTKQTKAAEQEVIEPPLTPIQSPIVSNDTRSLIKPSLSSFFSR